MTPKYCERIVISGEVGGKAQYALTQRCPALAVAGSKYCPIHLAELEGRKPPKPKRQAANHDADVLPWTADDAKGFRAAELQAIARRPMTKRRKPKVDSDVVPG